MRWLRSFVKTAIVALLTAMLSDPASAAPNGDSFSYYCYDAASKTAPADFKFGKTQGDDALPWNVTESDGKTYSAVPLPRKDPPRLGRGEAFGWEESSGNRKVAIVDFSDVVDEYGPRMATVLVVEKANPNGKKYQCVPSVIALRFKGEDRPGF